MKNFYPENYKLDLSETMKAALAKGPQVPEMQPGNTGIPGVGYVTEKLYMLLQLYLQNKGWNPSAELLQCFTDLKDNAMLPSAAYLQVLANRLTLDSQGRLILRENGKIVLPFEHFANAVMLKHMSGPHGLHLSVDATVRAVIESYTIGRENFGMEKEFIIEVVQSCPSPACRYYKNHLGLSPLPFMEQQFPGVNPADFLQHLPHLPPPHAAAAAGVGAGSSGSSSVGSSSGGEVDLTKPTPSHAQQKVPPQLQHLTKQQQNSIQSQLSQLSAAAAAHHQQQQQLQQQAAAKQQHQQQQQQQQLTAALIQQQNRALAQQSLEKFNSLSALEKQRVLQQLDPKHFDPMAVAAAAANLQMQGLMQPQGVVNAATVSSTAVAPPPPPPPVVPSGVTSNMANHHVAHHQLPPPSQSPTAHTVHSTSSSSSHVVEPAAQKNIETLRSNLESLESNKDLLALHNGAWGAQDANRDVMPQGQDKIVRVFAELMRNMARMKTYIRPSMCKPYGKQSESLQKTLMDTIQIVQTLRNCLPAPHIPVSSWKSESEGGSVVLQGNNVGVGVAANAAISQSRVENLSN
ncbi:uncharacterized protein LOC119671794 isoform X2 [Teleopsis dalmanni]|nr:uncharacterized protein LOC119671794 isoform X2 [Teleopsis dalmanni]